MAEAKYGIEMENERLIESKSAMRLAEHMERPLTRSEKLLVQQLETEVEMFQQRCDGDWLGTFIPQIRKAIGNPTDLAIEQLLLPVAFDILLEAFNVSNEELSDDDKRDEVPLNKFIDAVLRLLLAGRQFLYDAKLLLSIGLKLYPNAIILYKLYYYIAISRQSQTWKTQQLKDALSLFDNITNPDAEIWAMRGDLARALWRLDRGQRDLAEQAVVCYVRSYHICREGTQPVSVDVRLVGNQGDTAGTRHIIGLGYGMPRAVLMLVEMLQLELKQPKSKIAKALRQQVTQYLTEYVLVLRDCEQRLLDVESEQDAARVRGDEQNEALVSAGVNAQIQAKLAVYFQMVMAQCGLSNYQDAEQYARKFGFLTKLHTHLLPDLLFYPEITEFREEFAMLGRMILFSGASLPAPDQPAITLQWHAGWKTVKKMLLQAQMLSLLTVSRANLVSSMRGKLGLSLSGTGLKSAFLQIGMLARLAECDMLRFVDVISCSGGGCLIAGHYYLLLKELLEHKPDEDLSKTDFIDLVHRLIVVFSKGTENDIVDAAYGSAFKNLAISFGREQRTSVIAEEMHRNFFASHVRGAANIIKHRRQSLKMRLAKITPVGWTDDIDFDPEQHNWMRNAHVPTIHFNCTNLTTGHNWEFSTTGMGESVDMNGGDKGVDSNPVLEFVRYDEVQKPELRDISYADCVSVGALDIVGQEAPPFALDSLYPNHGVLLADGSALPHTALKSLLQHGSDWVIGSHMDLSLSPAQTEHLSGRRGAVPREHVLRRMMHISQQRSADDLVYGLRDRLKQFGVTDLCFIHPQQIDRVTPKERAALNHNRRVSPFTLFTSPSKVAALTNFSSPKQRRGHDRRSSILQMVDAKDDDSDDDYERAEYRAEQRRKTHGQKRNQSPMHSSRMDVRPEVARQQSLSTASNSGKPLTLWHVLRSEVLNMRTSFDAFTEVERNALMAVGYMLSCDALESCASRSLSGGQFGHMTDLDQADEESEAERRKSSAMSVNELDGARGRHRGRPSSPIVFSSNTVQVKDPSKESAKDTISRVVGFNDKQWAFFDVNAIGMKNWAFSPMQVLLADAAVYEVDASRLLSHKSLAFTDHEKLAREMLRSKLFRPEEFTDNAALVELHQHLRVSSLPHCSTRVFAQSQAMLITSFVLMVLPVLAVLAWGTMEFVELLSDHSITYSACWCLLEQPLFYLMFASLVLLLIVRPGWLTRITKDVVLLPVKAAASKHVFTPQLLRWGQEKRIRELHDAFIASHQSRRHSHLYR